MAELKLYQVCVFGPRSAGKTRLVHNLLCEAHTQYESNMHTEDIESHTFKIEINPDKYLDNLNIRFVDMIGFHKNQITNERHENVVFGEMEKYYEIIQGEINTSDVLLVCFDISRVFIEIHNIIDNSKDNHINVDKDHMISDFFDKMIQLHWNKKPVIVILTFFDEFLGRYHDDELLRSTIITEFKNLITTFCQRNEINFIEMYEYNVKKRFDDNHYGYSDVFILQKILSIGGGK